MNEHNLQWAGEASQALHGLSKEAVEWVSGHFEAAHPVTAARFSASDKVRFRKDISQCLRMLRTALASCSSGSFEEHVRWLATMMKNRGIPSEQICELLWLLDRFIAARLRGELAESVRAILQAGIRILETAQPALPAFYRKLPTPAPESPAFTEALLAGDQRGAKRVVDAKLDAGADLIEVDVTVVQPAMYEIGQRWQYNQISVVQEHLATAICQTVLAGALIRGEPAPPCDQRALFACVEDNFHCLGLRMVADAFELAGWDSAYLGADVPTAALLSQIESSRPDVVGLSVSLPQHIEKIHELIRLCRLELGTQCPSIMVGGLAMNSVDDLWQRIEADYWYPDARTAQHEAL
jgi:methanogenic corrinoid protein MtbC1